MGGEEMAENILVIHGMRKGKQNNIIYEFVKQLMMSKHRHVYISFLECETRNLKVVMSNLIQQGYFEFNIIPLLLFPAKHYLHDIPSVLKSLKRDHPHITSNIAQPLGTHRDLPNIINRRIANALVSAGHVNRIILITHGSSYYKEPDYALKKLITDCNGFNTPIQMMTVYGDYSYQLHIEKYLNKGESILIVPVFLYNGFLVNKIKKEISQLNIASRVYYSDVINFNNEISAIIEDRIQEIEELANVSYST